MEHRRPRCKSVSPKRVSPNASPKKHASPPKAAPDVGISFVIPNTSGRCASPRRLSPKSHAAAAAAEAVPVGWMQSMGNCIGKFCSKGNKTLKPKQPSAVQASAAASMMNTMPMPPPMQYMTQKLAKEERMKRKAEERRRIAQMKRQTALKEQQRELEEQQRELEEQQRAIDEQKRNLKEEVIRVDESKREVFEKSLRQDVPHFAIQPCGICNKIHKTSNCPSLKKHEQKIEEQQLALEAKRRSLEEQLKELLEEMGHLSHEHADGGAKTKRRHSKSKRSKSRSHRH